jgi:class 3 adenylate cyclase
MGRLVLRPVARVAVAARRIGGGDFKARVPINSEDEIGQLGTVINDMTTRLKTAHEELAEKNRTLDETLHNLQNSMKRVELLEQLKNELGKFVPVSVKRMLEQNPEATELEQCEKDVSAIFLDIAGYTHLSEQMEAKQLNRLLQRYFSSFLDTIHNYQGDVNETAGDGLMVIFQNDRSSAEHALNAVRSALAIQRQVEELNQEFAGVFNPVSLHMGINSGPALVGASKLTSSAGPRWIFTALGPVINVAARVAGEAKAGEIFMSSSTAERVKEHFILERLGERRLKNVADPVQLYRLIEPGVYDRVVRAVEGSAQFNSAACSNYAGYT